jgi:hypothetical protein
MESSKKDRCFSAFFGGLSLLVVSLPVYWLNRTNLGVLSVAIPWALGILSSYAARRVGKGPLESFFEGLFSALVAIGGFALAWIGFGKT